jgi:hypothetical protein
VLIKRTPNPKYSAANKVVNINNNDSRLRCNILNWRRLFIGFRKIIVKNIKIGKLNSPISTDTVAPPINKIIDSKKIRIGIIDNSAKIKDQPILLLKFLWY